MSASVPMMSKSNLLSVDESVIEQSIRRQALQSLSKRLYYSIAPSSSSLIKNRKTVAFPSQNLKYEPGQTVVIKVSSGQFIDVQNSYLRFKLCTNVKTAQLGMRGVEQLIQRFRVVSSSGSVLEDVEEYGLYCKNMVDNSASQNYRTSSLTAGGWWDERNPYKPTSLSARVNGAVTGAISGADIKDNTAVVFDEVAFGEDNLASSSRIDATGNGYYAQQFWAEGVNAGTSITAEQKGDAVNTFCVPLYGSGLFSSPNFLPGRQLGNLDIELTLSPAAHVILTTEATVQASYKISNLELILDTITLADDIAGLVDKLSESQKLTIVYDTVQRSTHTLSGSSANLTINKFSANVSGIHGVIRDFYNISTGIAATDLQRRDSFASVNQRYITEAQVRIDSDFYPVKPISSVTEQYVEFCLKAFNRLNHSTFPAISLIEFINGKGSIAWSFNKDESNQSFSGLNLRGARSINLTLKLDDTYLTALSGSKTAQLDIWVIYTRTATILPNQNMIIAE